MSHNNAILLEVFGGGGGEVTIGFAMNITFIFPLLLASNFFYHISHVLKKLKNSRDI